MSCVIAVRQRSTRAGVRTACRLAGLIAALVLGGCGEPLPPGGSVTTFDDPGTGSWVAVSAGREHTCALTADSAAMCWGNNASLQVGVPRGDVTCVRPHDDRMLSCELRPVPVTGGLHFARISAGGSHSCGLTADGRVFCWGSNLHGQLGVLDVRETWVPAEVTSSARFVDVAAGGEHTCAVRTDGIVMCWGDNNWGQLAMANTALSIAVPTQIEAPLRVRAIVAGELRTCGLGLDRKAYCWGREWFLQDSDGGDIVRQQTRPIRVDEAPALQSLAAGGSASCAIDASNAVVCWESNVFGTLGDGTRSGTVFPVPVGGALRAVRVSSGRRHACAVAVDGLAWCWGAGESGQLGVSPATLKWRCASGVACTRLPVRVTGWRQFLDVSAGLGDHACGVTLSRNIYCWGAGRMGQRGDSSRFDSAVPIRTLPTPIL